MSYLNKKSEPFDPKDEQIPAGALNNIRDATPRQIRGSGDVDVQQFGDRTVVRGRRDMTRREDSHIYYAKFVVLREFDDYLRCAPFYQPVDSTSHLWVPQGYDKDLEQATQVPTLVAKPNMLQKSVWNGKTVNYLGENLSVAFDGVTIGQRTVTDTGGAVQTQRISSPYVPGDVIVARRCVTGLQTSDGYPVFWQDENEAARQWVTDSVTGTPTQPARIFGGPVNVGAVGAAQIAKYETYWRFGGPTFNAYYLGGGDRCSGPATSMSLLSKGVYAFPFLVVRAMNLASLSVHFPTTTVGGKVWLGIYANDGTVLPGVSPGTLIADVGEVNANIGIVDTPININVAAYTLLWFVMQSNTTPPVITSRKTYDLWPLFTWAVPDRPIVGYYASPAAYGAMPASFNTFGTVSYIGPVTTLYGSGYTLATDNVPWIATLPGGYL